MELQVFSNAEFGSVRSTMIKDEPWFVGKDVAEILGYSRTADAIKAHVDAEDKGVCEMPTPGGVQNATIINESGLYSLILSSKMPNAKKFKRWVTSEVLPAIRKHGVFAVDTMLNDPDAIIVALQAYKEERQRRLLLESENAVQKQQLLEMKPKVSYYDVVINSPDLISITEIAKDYGWSAKRMNGYLHSKGIQYKQGDRIWILYQKYAEQGLTSTKTHAFLVDDGSTHTKVHTYWTQKGRLFIYDLLKKDGILPLIEKEDIESVLFSDKDKLIKYLTRLSGNNHEQDIREYVDTFYRETREALESVRSDLYSTMKNKFASQKKPTRPELEHVEFDSYAAEASGTIQFVMLKDNIKRFVIGLESLLGNQIIERDDDESETVAAGMLNTYLNTVESVSDIYEDYLDMFTKIKTFIV